jgi:c(7)-type cytochrome triheme protein
MRKAFFFSFGLVAALILVVLFADGDARSAAKKKRPPQLRGKQSIVFPAPKDSEYLPVTFSHSSHGRFGFKKCTACHDDKVFSKDQSLGTNAIHMDDIYQGKWCGHCHNGKLLNKDGNPVFAPKDEGVDNCVLCHNVKAWTKPDAAKAWKPPADVKPLEGKIEEEGGEEEK